MEGWLRDRVEEDPALLGLGDIPNAIRGLFGLLSRTAYMAVRKSFQALFGRTDIRPGCVVSIRT
jgi:hypothetical protein